MGNSFTSFLCDRCHTEIQASPDMVGQETECPACGAGLAFDPTTGDMGCAYCDSHFTLQQLAELSAAEEESAATANQIQWDT